MGINSGWYYNFEHFLEESRIAFKKIDDPNFVLIRLLDNKIIINCVSVRNTYKPEQVVLIQQRYLEEGFQVINLWEDVWYCRSAQVSSRLHALLGRNQRLHGRKTNVISLNKQQADEFLSAFHIQGSARARHKYGLFYENELVAVATFSGTRIMRQHTAGYRSAELIRFASKPGFTVIGGLTKLIRHFTSQVKTDDIMSYADRDWSLGQAYEVARFSFHSLTPPSDLWLDTWTYKRYFHHRLPDIAGPSDSDISKLDCRFVKIFNTGNLKYILYL